MSGSCASIRYITGAFTSPHSLPSYAAVLSSPPPSPSSFRLRLHLRLVGAHHRRRGMVSPVRPLMPPLSWGRLRGRVPSSSRHCFPVLCNHRGNPSQPTHPPPLLAPLRRTARRCNPAIVYASNLSNPPGTRNERHTLALFSR